MKKTTFSACIARRKTAFWAITSALTVMAVLASTLPEDELGRVPPLLYEETERLGHVLGFFVLTASFSVMIRHAYSLSQKLSLALSSSFTLGASILSESLQFVAPGREPSFFDLGLDMLGVFIGASLAFVITNFSWRKGR